MEFKEALEHSIVKWKLFSENEYEEQDEAYKHLVLVHPEMENFKANCGLCERHNSNCDACELHIAGESCKADNSLYDTWDKEPSSENAEKMLNVLLKLKNDTRRKIYKSNRALNRSFRFHRFSEIY